MKIFHSEGMSSTQDLIFFIILTVEIIIGIWGNGLVGAVNCMDWVRHRKINFINFILTNLSITRISFCIAILTDSFLMMLSSDPHAFDQIRIINILFGIVTNHLSAWFDTCLSIFYLFKIATFFHPLFLWLKWRMNKVIIIFFLGSFLFLLITIPAIDYIISVTLNVGTNKTWKIKMNETETIIFLLFLSVEITFPITISIASFLLLIVSLWRHAKKMKFNILRSQDPSTEAHVKAMKMMISCFFLFLMYIVFIVVCIYSYLLFPSRFVSTIGKFIVSSHVLGHSFIIIWGNRKIKQAALRVLGQLKCFVRRKKSLNS